MALSWIKLDAALPTHRKAVELAALTGDPRAWTYLVALWAWASQNEPTGLIRGAAARMVVEHAVGWRGTPGLLADSMVTARWLDPVDEGLFLHDWPEHQGAHINHAEREAERKRLVREKTKVKYSTSSVLRASCGRPADGAADGAQDFSKRKRKTESIPLSATEPPKAGRTTSTDGEDDDAPVATVFSLQDRMGEAFRKARGRELEWPLDPYPVLRAIGDRCADEAEVLRRLDNALTYTRFPRFMKPADLPRFWENYAEPEPKPATTPKRGAAASSADKDWDKPVETYVDEFGNERLA